MGEVRQKAGVLSVATTVIATGAARLADGAVYVGGALLATGLVLFALYEVYQIRQLPEGLGEEDVKRIAEEVGADVEEAVEDTETQ
jgi:hypothetical protein